MRYFETQKGDYVALEHAAVFGIADYGADNLKPFALRVFTAAYCTVCGEYETKAEAESAKLAVILWATNDDVKLFSFKDRNKEGPAWKLARMGPGIIDLIESAEAYRKMQERKAVTEAEANTRFEENHTIQCRRDYIKPTSGRPDPEWVRGRCPKCEEDLVSNCYQVPGQSRSIVCWDCWNSLGPNPACDYSKVL